MTEPLVSVHMITYNHAPYIAKAIESVLAQKTSFAFELVIGEDCSTDGTHKIVFDYARRFPRIVRLITSDKNVGMHENSYRTTRACCGRYIAYCEGDDYWHREDKLQIQVDYLESHSECGLVHSDQNRQFEKAGCLIEAYFQTTGRLPPKEIDMFTGWDDCHILTCTVVARRAMVDSILSKESFYRGTDYIGGTDIPLFIELSMIARIHYINESLATYTVREESACHFTDRAKQSDFVRSVIGCYLHLAKKYGVQEAVKQLENRYVSAVLDCALWNKDGKIAEDLISQYPLNGKQRLKYLSVRNAYLGGLMRYALQAERKIKQCVVRTA